MTQKTIVRAVVTRRFKASPERVFDAFLDPAKAGRFMFVTKDGTNVRAEIDARVGGSYIFTDRRDGEDVEHVGEYLVIDRPHRLVFTLSVEKYTQDADRVTVEIVPDGNGSKLVLTHEMKPEYAEYEDRTKAGWTSVLESLAQVLGEESNSDLLL
jgi:uncharacterized protein YndB with AHSA1/START domain